jgi:hypothetical protein
MGEWIILKWILGQDDMDWIYLALDRDLWRALAIMLMKPGIPQRTRSFGFE